MQVKLIVGVGTGCARLIQAVCWIQVGAHLYFVTNAFCEELDLETVGLARIGGESKGRLMVQSQDVGIPQDVTAGAAPKETKNIDDSGVAPESLQKTPGKQIPTVSRKGQRAIGACLLSLAVGIAVGIFIGYRMKHGGYDTPFFTDGFGNVCEFTL